MVEQTIDDLFQFNGKFPKKPSQVATFVDAMTKSGFRVKQNLLGAGFIFSLDGGKTWQHVNQSTKAIAYMKMQQRCKFEVIKDGDQIEEDIAFNEGAIRRGEQIIFGEAEQFHPFGMWLDKLKPKRNDEIVKEMINLFKYDDDGRIKQVWEDYFLDAIRCFMLGMIRKIRCKGEETRFDKVLVFQGASGCGKSAFMKNLLPSHNGIKGCVEAFGLPFKIFNSSFSWSNDVRNIVQQASRSVLIESKEMIGGGKLNNQVYKNIVEQTDDTYVPKYANEPMTFDRLFMFGITTNEHKFMPNDPEPDRRTIVLNNLAGYHGHSSEDQQIKNGRRVADFFEANREAVWAHYLDIFNLGDTGDYDTWSPSSLDYRSKRAEEVKLCDDVLASELTEIINVQEPKTDGKIRFSLKDIRILLKESPLLKYEKISTPKLTAYLKRCGCQPSRQYNEDGKRQRYWEKAIK